MTMSDSLKDYLASRGARQLDVKLLEEYLSEMTEQVIPKIEKDIRDRDKLAAELRYSPSISTRHRNHRR